MKHLITLVCVGRGVGVGGEAPAPPIPPPMYTIALGVANSYLISNNV